MAKSRTLSAEEFVDAYRSCETYDDLVALTGMSRGTLMSRASRYRSKGVELDHMARRHGPRPLDVEALNRRHVKVLEAHDPVEA